MYGSYYQSYSSPNQVFPQSRSVGDLSFYTHSDHGKGGFSLPNNNNTYGPYAKSSYRNIEKDYNYCHGQADMVAKLSKREVTPLMEEFFGDDNVKRVQRKIRNEIYNQSRGKFRG